MASVELHVMINVMRHVLDYNHCEDGRAYMGWHDDICHDRPGIKALGMWSGDIRNDVSAHANIRGNMSC